MGQIVQEPARELLKVDHPGIPISTSQELLAPVHPTSAGISFGKDNSYASRYQVFERLEQAAVKRP